VIFSLAVSAVLLGQSLGPADVKVADQIISATDEYVIGHVDRQFVDGFWEEILPLLRWRREIYPTDYDVVTDLGFLLTSGKKVEEALTLYRQYERDVPTDPDRFLPRGGLFYLQKKWPQVIEALVPTRGTPCHPNNLRMLAKAYEETGDLKNAEATFAEFVKRFPNDGPAKKNLERVRGKLKAQG
jgi:hypothetical protein